jgi:hypothetical protein
MVISSVVITGIGILITSFGIVSALLAIIYKLGAERAFTRLLAKQIRSSHVKAKPNQLTEQRIREILREISSSKLNEKGVESALTIIEPTLTRLDLDQRRRVLEGLNQTSVRGKADYISKIFSQALNITQ